MPFVGFEYVLMEGVLVYFLMFLFLSDMQWAKCLVLYKKEVHGKWLLDQQDNPSVVFIPLINFNCTVPAKLLNIQCKHYYLNYQKYWYW